MKLNVTLYNSNTNDLVIVIDLLRASTTMSLALDSFEEIIPVSSVDEAFKLKEEYDVVLAGEKNAKKIENFDVSNSPCSINDFSAKILVIKTTNGTKVINNILEKNNNVKILIGAAVNARNVAKKALELAKEEINLVMAGVKQEFTIEDCVGAGLIINEILDIAEKQELDIKLSESAQVAHMISNDEEIAKNLIDNSQSANRLRNIGAFDDIEISKSINITGNVPFYKEGKIISIK